MYVKLALNGGRDEAGRLIGEWRLFEVLCGVVEVMESAIFVGRSVD